MSENTEEGFSGFVHGAEAEVLGEDAETNSNADNNNNNENRNPNPAPRNREGGSGNGSVIRAGLTESAQKQPLTALFMALLFGYLVGRNRLF